MKHLILICCALFVLSSCQQSDPPSFGRSGTEVYFSDMVWDVKVYENQTHGPGPNYFSPYEDDIFVDEDGYLHMRIANHDDKWFSSEIVSRKITGYGKYKWVIEGDFVNVPSNTVVGLFTWDNTTFFSDGNSEIDIELSKWGNASDPNTLQYAVQPVFFGDYYAERVRQQITEPADLIGVSTHVFNWTDTLVTWYSYKGDTEDESALIGSWSFDLDNPPRVKEEGGNQSDPIVIPAPGPETNVSINFWTLPWIADGPEGGEEQEYIVRSFDYTEF